MCKPDCIHNNNKNFYQKRCHRKTQVCKNDMFFLFFILIYLYLLHDKHTRTHTLFTIIFNWSKEYGKKFINNFRFFRQYAWGTIRVSKKKEKTKQRRTCPSVETWKFVRKISFVWKHLGICFFLVYFYVKLIWRQFGFCRLIECRLFFIV